MEDNNDMFSSYNTEVEFKEKNELIDEREKFIKLAQKKLSLNRDETILAMIFLKWNRNNYDKWLLNNPEENRVRAGLQLSNETREMLEKKGIRSNGDRCLRCGKMRDNTFYSLNCGHQFCSECWTNYLKEKIRNPSLRVTCPQIGCTCIVYERLYEEYLGNINDSEIQANLAELKKVIFSDFIHGAFFRRCPNATCRYYAKSRTDGYIQEVYCKCGTNYCFECSKEPHSPCYCELITTFNELHDNENRNQINPNYDTYYKRFSDCDQSIQEAKTIFSSDDFNNTIRSLRDRIKFLMEDLDMMREAFKLIIKARITLKYAVVFEFFMKECNNKNLFRQSQIALKNEIEELYRLLLPAYLKPFIERREMQRIEDIKDEIEKRSKQLKDNRDTFISDAGNTYISDLDKDLMKVNGH